MGDVFDISESEFFRDASLDAAYELGLVDVLTRAPRPRDSSWAVDALAHAIAIGSGKRRLRLLLDVLVGYGFLHRDGGYVLGQLAPRPARPVDTARSWGAAADVIKRDEALPPAEQDTVARMHVHLATAGALAAQETAQLIGALLRVTPHRLVDLGGGAGAYTSAFLAAAPDARATLVDVEEVIPLAREHLSSFATRVDFLASDIRAATITDASVALLANVLHLHGPDVCAQLCKVAASVVAPGGIVVIKDLRMDTDASGVRTGPLQSLLFALNMGIFTQDGDVHETPLLREWLAAAGLVEIEERRLGTSPNAIVVVGRKP